ncbi:hypothetical protein G5B30_02910 [Sphingobacterium sp. SGG-5]|uniref:hypothetical protein n=1 Tax=Sphingobacterium sp. SGG-5 TaxID=2710881 RepID=UPI0013EA81B3|nr:hypothetical protein [Sphingobacterium sp. SGG-5]NGM60862.1 hypothetical protein [Sphingobacterium sp. SGG-5]
MKVFVGVFFLYLLSACSTRSDQELRIFSVDTGEAFTVNGHEEIEDQIVWIEDTSDTQVSPVFELTGSWDLSEYNQLKVVLVNANKREHINATLKIAGRGPSREEGSLESKVSIRGGETLEWIIPIVPSPVYPAILKRMTGMRATPFSIDGVTSTLNPEKIDRISISFDKGLKGTRLGIKNIVAVKGTKVPTPEWFAFSEEKFFPFIDKYGQFIHKDWPGKTKNDSDLHGDLQRELEEIESNPGPADRGLYGGWLKGKRLEATGNFQVRKVDGKWWMVDPDGYLFWSHGVVRVTPSSAVTIIDNRENFFSALPDVDAPFGEFYKTKDEFLYRYYQSWGINKTYDFSAANIRIKYGEDWRVAYRDMVFRRLRSWGMNTISAGSAKEIYHENRVPYCDRIELGSPRIEGAPDRLNVIKDPFHPDFGEKFAEQLRERGDELLSPWCYGYFVDNKLVWGADHDLARWVLKSPAQQAAKKIFIANLKNKYGTIEALNVVWKSTYKSWDELLATQQEPPEGSIKDCAAFSAVLIEEYFKNIGTVMQQVAPGKLYLGCRYVTVNEKVLQIAAKYCDVLTFDLFWDSLADFKLPEGIDKPVLIGEFHFGALDRGLFHPGLNQKADQQERAQAYEKYVRSALRNPFIIGTAWHQFSDQATTGRFDGENFQDGLTDVCDRVYSETISKVKEIGKNLYQIRMDKY